MHGAFANASSWNDVVGQLQADEVQVTAAANPLRGIPADSAYIASLLGQTPGPVVAVGHSYGGAVISNAAAKADNVVDLVYVATFAPDEDESPTDIESNSKDSVPLPALVELRYPTRQGLETAVKLAIKPENLHDANDHT